MSTTRWMIAFILAASVTIVGEPAGWACLKQTKHCETTFDWNEAPGCVHADNFTTPCEADVIITNQCSEAITFVELDCGNDCAEPVTFEPGESGELVFQRASGGSFYAVEPVGWMLGEQEGVFQISIDEEVLSSEPCEGFTRSACAATGSPQVQQA